MEYIYTIENNLSSNVCEEIIRRFENDDRKHPGLTVGGINKAKKSTDLSISDLDEWSDIDKILYDSLSIGKDEYFEYIKYMLLKNNAFPNLNETFSDMGDTGYQIQRVRKGEYYDWHEDETNFDEQRFISYIWYLNTLDDDEGGKTLFSNGKSIRPVCGNLVLFPANWTYFHKGEEVLGKTKYIITGWITRKLLGQHEKNVFIYNNEKECESHNSIK